MDGKLLNEQHLVSFLKRRVNRLIVHIRVKMPHCWKSHVAAHFLKTEEIKYSATDPTRECCSHQRDQIN